MLPTFNTVNIEMILIPFYRLQKRGGFVRLYIFYVFSPINPYSYLNSFSLFDTFNELSTYGFGTFEKQQNRSI